ncbi:hypothetical protein [Fusobacterium russii]|uniref:hypothetical protein n=1 Tax=Fusobacterium russii TaxID=854 RepID=UPI00039B64FC|nr:hypothetical protein [Fusobacterium russii]
MVFKLKLEDHLKLRLLILVILYLLFFYFFIFKNILTYLELNEFITSQQIKIEKLNLENTELSKSLILKEENLKKELLLLEELKEKTDEKLLFPKISDAFKLINMYMDKNNISFESFGRSQKNGNIKSISFSFKAFEENCINFLQDLENSEYYFKLNESYFSLTSLNSQVLCKLTIKFKLSDNFEKTSNPKNINENIFLKVINKDRSSSYMRIGNNKFYRTYKNNKEKLSSEENKTLKKD